MENGVEALHIAFGMLIFVLAISITISCFGSASHALQGIWSSRNLEEEFITDINGNYLNYVKFDGGTREVGVDTIVPMMYRAYREIFAIYFYSNTGIDVDGDGKIDKYDPFVLYKYNGENINYIDFEKDQDKKNNNQIDDAAEYLNKILGKDIQVDSTTLQHSDSYTEDSLYQALAGRKFIEKQGWYYISGNTEGPDANKIPKKIIAYILK